jgi:hypothetical protein
MSTTPTFRTPGLQILTQPPRCDLISEKALPDDHRRHLPDRIHSALMVYVVLVLMRLMIAYVGRGAGAFL